MRVVVKEGSELKTSLGLEDKKSITERKKVSLDVLKASHLLHLQYQEHYPPHPRSDNSSSVGEGVRHLGEREKDRGEF